MAKKKQEIKLIKQNIIESDFSTEMKNSYRDYALEVIAQRALPDIRDGLKPVQRRILYSMSELGITNDKPYKKCGRIVGDTMGKYHPHGDTSIYDALVRMAQDFQLNIPLIDGHGNFGSIDGDGAAAMRYCITGETLISTNKGLLRIDEIVKDSKLESDNDIKINIKSIYNKNNTASKFFNSGIHPTYKVDLRNGMSITGTDNHPLLIINKLGIFEWKLIKDIKTGDKCVIDLSTKNALYGKNNDLLEARMLGCMISEGYITTQNRIGISNSNLDMIIPVKEFLEKHSKTIAEINKTKDNMYVYCVADKDYHNIFIDKYKYSKKAKNKTIPKCVLQGTKEYQKEFLRYLFEGDGSVSYSDSPYYTSSHINLSYRTYSEELAKQLQIILATQFGILSYISKTNKKKNVIEYKVNISSIYIQKFKKEIGFVSKQKNNILKIIPEVKPANNSYSWHMEISNYIKNCNVKIKRNIATLHQLPLVKDYIKKEEYEYCEYILNDLGLVEVSDKNYVGENIVYSIRVDSNCHSFVANGFINHNTESRLSKISNELIDGLRDKIVNFIPNFDEEELEPELLPCRFPNLLVNGSTGIAVGLATNIPPHNLKETIDMIISFIKKDPIKQDRLNGKDNPLTNKKLLDIIKGPDFATGGIIVNEKDLLDIYSTGDGKIYVRGVMDVEEDKNGKKYLIIKEIPYTLSGRKVVLIDKIVDLIKTKKIEEINEVRDESDKNIRIVLELKKDVDVEKVKNKLYKFSPLQDTFSVKLLALLDGHIETLDLKSYCRYFVDFQRDLYIKEMGLKSVKLNHKIELLKGLIKAFDCIDVIIDMIRHSDKVDSAKKCLMTGSITGIKFSSKKNETIAKKFDFTEVQAEYILETTLRKLNNLEINKITDNLNDLIKESDKLKNILENEKELDKVIISRLQKISKDYNVERKTKIINSEIIEYTEIKKVYNANIMCDKYGYIKVFDDDNYQKLDESAFERNKLNIKTDTADNLWCFSSEGFMYQIKIDSLPFNKIKDKGVMLDSKINKKIEGDIILYTSEKTCKKILFITKKGLVKVVTKDEFITNRSITQSTKLSKDDEILKIIPLEKDLDIVVHTEDSYLRFNTNEIAEQKKTAIGVVSIKTENELLNVQIINDDTKEILINNKSIPIDKLKKQKRGSKGTKI